MKNQENDIAKQRQAGMSFTFEEKDNKLIIKTQKEEVIYSAEMEANSFFTFEDVISSLQSSQYTVVAKTPQILKMKVGGFLNLNFVGEQKVTLDGLKQTIKQLKSNIQKETEKNIRLQAIVQVQQNQIKELKAALFSLREQMKKLQQKQLDQEAKASEDANQIKKMSKRIEILEQNFKENNVKAEHKLSELTNQNNHQKSKLQSLQSIITQQRQTIFNLSVRLNVIEDKINDTKMHSVPKSINLQTQLFVSSKVILNPEQKGFIKGFFPTKKIKNAELLYRASDNEFDVKRFHEKCDNIPNTLLVCHTQFEKKIGGFTPLTWTSSQVNQVKADNTKETFIFSLTHNDKFSLQNTSSAILSRHGLGPFFGYGGNSTDIGIHNNADQNTCCTFPNNYYYNSNYTKGSKDSLERFNGSSNSSNWFFMKEWEVWRLVFE